MFIYEYGYKLSGIRMNVRTQGQLSPLEIGEDNSKFEPKKLRKIQVHQYGQTKGCSMGF